MNNLIQEIPIKIISEQELIIGPLAWDLAEKISGLSVDKIKKTVSITGEPKNAIDSMVGQYERLFGLASQKICKDASKDILSKLEIQEIPESLKR